ncbi:MAG: hypothetical protein KJ667_02505, partial [Alphaproteobacteria bacterium]|nr:hypothetical protein [Alphaproteobacteria bacterium]
FTMSVENMDELEEWERTGYNPADEILSAEKIDSFFDHLFEALQAQRAKASYTATGHNRYLELRQSFGTSSNHPAYPDYPFSDALETAIAAAGIHRHALPQRTPTYMHDDGQLFVPQTDAAGKPAMISVVYPERPALPHRHITMGPRDMDHCPTLTWETLYRTVPLQPGQKYKSGYFAVNGERITHESEAFADEVLLVGNNDVDSLDQLTSLADEDILAFNPPLRGSYAQDRKKCTPGYRDTLYNSFVEAAGQPNMIRSLIPDIAFIKVSEPVQLGTGSNFVTAQPGDYIIRESQNGTPRVIAHDLVNNGRVRFIFPASAPNPRLN